MHVAGLREERRISNKVLGLLSHSMECQDYFFECVNLILWYNICDQFCANNMILFLPLLPVPCGIFREEQSLFILTASRTKYLTSLFTDFPPPPFPKASFRDLCSEQDRPWFVCCVQEDGRSQKEGEPFPNLRSFAKYILTREIHSKAHLSSICKMNYLKKKSHLSSKRLLEIY